MGRKLPQATIRAAALALTGTPAVVVGTVVGDAANAITGAFPLAQLSMVRAWGTYTRGGGSAAGAPRFGLELSCDPPTTAPGNVAHWQAVPMLDGSSFAAGAINAYPYGPAAEPSAAGSATRGSPPFDVRAAQWARLLVSDVDGAAPGQIAALRFAGET
jgi:hypothetical protein